MALRLFTVTRGNNADAVAPKAYTTTTDLSGLSTATVTADIAAAQAIGVGDASAEIDTIDTDYQALVAQIAAIQGPAGASVSVIVDTAGVSSLNDVRRAFDAVLAHLKSSNLIPAA